MILFVAIYAIIWKNKDENGKTIKPVQQIKLLQSNEIDAKEFEKYSKVTDKPFKDCKFQIRLYQDKELLKILNVENLP